MTRLIQIQKGNIRRVAMIEAPNVRLLENCSSIYELAQIADGAGTKLSEAARNRVRDDKLDYDLIYKGGSEWRLLHAIDHPQESACCLVSGTGPTHIGSARGRQSMDATATEDLTDSMKMFRWGVEGGRPGAGDIVARDGRPLRIALVVGDEFSDYLYLAGSRLRTCALGPEILLDAAFDSIPVVGYNPAERRCLVDENFPHR
jgi:hypothetical protein